MTFVHSRTARERAPVDSQRPAAAGTGEAGYSLWCSLAATIDSLEVAARPMAVGADDQPAELVVWSDLQQSLGPRQMGSMMHFARLVASSTRQSTPANDAWAEFPDR